MKKRLIQILFVFLTIITFIPNTSFSATTGVLDYSGWVQCDGVVLPNAEGESLRNKTCNYQNLISMAKYLINWLFTISIPIIIGLLAYSGLLHISGKPENIKKSYTIMQNAVIGLIIMLLAWFIVTTLLKWLLNPEFKGVDAIIEIQK